MNMRPLWIASWLAGCAGSLALAGCLAAGPIEQDRTNRATANPSVHEVDHDTHWLIIGGGSRPTSNQFSLESNFLYYQRLLDQTDLPSVLRHFLFADGGTDQRDLQYRLDEDQLSEQDRMRLTLAQIMGQTNEILNRYRANQVPDLAGPASREQIHGWFDEKADQLQSGDRVFIYFTGHGIGGTDDDKHNTTMQLWDSNSAYRMYELADQFDKLPADVQIIMLMVQCHSGGFAHIIFNDGKPANGLAEQTRIGFFATIPERLAAGCSPSVDEANFQEYSSYFWAGLFGENRIGQPVQTPDFNGDGRVSLAEAHAHVLLTSRTIDIPITTSDALLRQYSTIQGDDVLGEDTDYSLIRDHAEPHQAAVLDGLSDMLELTGSDRIAQAQRKAQAIEQQREDLAEQRDELRQSHNRHRRRIANSLLHTWPELRNAWHPVLPELLETDGPEMIQTIESHRAYDRLLETRQRISEISHERHQLEVDWVMHQRFIYTAKSVLKAINLPEVADEQIVEHYHRIIDAENAVLAF